MTGFLSGRRFFLAGCAVSGTIPPSILAAPGRTAVLAVMAFAAAGVFAYVLLTAAVSLHNS